MGHSGGGLPSSLSPVVAGSRQSLLNQTRKISTSVNMAQTGMTTPKIVLGTFEASFPLSLLSFEDCSGEPMVGWLLFTDKKRVQNEFGVGSSSKCEENEGGQVLRGHCGWVSQGNDSSLGWHKKQTTRLVVHRCVRPQGRNYSLVEDWAKTSDDVQFCGA